MLRILRHTFAVIAIFFLTGSAAFAAKPLGEKELCAVLAKIDSQMAKAKSFEWDFEATSSSDILQHPVTSEGTLYYLAPDKIRLESTEAVVIINLSNKQLGLDFKDGKPMTKVDAKNFSGMVAINEMLAGKNMKPDNPYFNISGKDAGNFWIITMLPKSKDISKFIKSITQTIRKSDMMKTMVDIEMKDGSKTVYKGKKAVLDPKLSSNLFIIK